MSDASTAKKKKQQKKENIRQQRNKLQISKVSFQEIKLDAESGERGRGTLIGSFIAQPSYLADAWFTYLKSSHVIYSSQPQGGAAVEGGEQRGSFAYR